MPCTQQSGETRNISSQCNMSQEDPNMDIGELFGNSNTTDTIHHGYNFLGPQLPHQNAKLANGTPNPDTNSNQSSSISMTKTKQPQFSTKLDKLFLQARKEFGPRTTSSIAPNLTKARKRTNSNTTISRSSSEDSLVNTHQTQTRTNVADNSWTTSTSYKKPRKFTSPTPSDILSTNRYEPLNNIGGEKWPPTSSSDQNQDNTHHIQGNHNQNIQPPISKGLASSITKTHNKKTPSTQAKSLKAKPPPIYVYAVKIQTIINILKNSQMNRESFAVKQLSDGECTVYASSLEIFNSILKTFKENNYKFFTYTPKELKPRNLVLKGIAGDFSETDIKDEIDSLQLSNVNIIKVSKISFNRRLDTNDNKRSHFLIQLTNDSNTQNITSVKSLLWQKIRWEPLRKNTLFQCKNCQRIGHSSANCSLGFRCVKCSENHKPGHCELSNTNNDKNLLHCANCNEPGHPASYRGCPYFKFFKAQRNKELNSHQNDRRTRIYETNINLTKQTKSLNHTIIPTTPYNTKTNLFSSNQRATNYHQHNIDQTDPSAEKTRTRRYDRPTNSHNAWNTHNNNINHLFNSDNQPNPPEAINDLNSLLSGIKREINAALDSKLSNFQDNVQRAINTNSINIARLFNHLGINIEHNHE